MKADCQGIVREPRGREGCSRERLKREKGEREGEREREREKRIEERFR